MTTVNNSINNTLQSPFNIGATSVTTTGAQLNYLNTAANGNIPANNFIEGFNPVTSANTITVLTVASAGIQYLTGTNSQTFQMPVTSTLVVGQSWLLINNTNQDLIVVASDSSSIDVLAFGSGGNSVLVTCISTSDTTSAGWYYEELGLPQALGPQAGPTFNGVLLQEQTTSTPSLQIYPNINTSNTLTILTNDVMAQATTISIPDPLSSSGQLLIAATSTPFTSGHMPIASGTSGLMVDSGIAVASTAIQSVVVTMNTAAVTGAYATPVQLVATPGSGYTIILLNAQVYTNKSTAFATGGIAIIQYDSTIHGAGTNAASATIPAAEITAAASQIYSLIGKGAVSATVTTAVSNKGLYFSNATGAFTNGTSSSVTIALQYIVMNATV